MVTILCVDDEVDMEDMVKQMFRKQIRNNEYQFVFAHNGREALIQLNQHPETKLILSDINMPEMDGLTLLGHIKEDYKNNYLKTIMVSAYGDMQNIRTAMNKGAFDFVTKPIMFDDFDKTIKKTINEIEIYSALLSEHDKLVSIQADLSTAHEIQQAMLPKDPDPYPNRKEFSLHGLVEPAKSVGGDLFDYVLIDENRLFFMIGDVSDKGVQASLIMAITNVLFKTRFTNNPSADLVAEVCMINNLLSTDNPQMMFVTTFASILDLTTGEVEYVDGGHERPLIIRAATGDIEILEKKDGGLPLGIQTNFPYKSNTFKLNPGDTFFLYTDGLEDALNIDGKRYKIESSISLIKDSLHKDPPLKINMSLLKSVKEYIGDFNQFDDIGMLTIKYNGTN